MPAPVGAPPGGGLDLKRLPPWAWGVAIAGGAVVGFVFLKKKPGSSDQGGGASSPDQASSGDQGGGGGAPGAPPVIPDLTSLGLSPGYVGPTYSSGLSGAGGVGGAGNSDGVDTGGATLTQTLQSPLYSLLPSLTGRTTPAFVGALAGAPQVQSIYQGGALSGKIATPSAPSPSPAPSLGRMVAV